MSASMGVAGIIVCCAGGCWVCNLCFHSSISLLSLKSVQVFSWFYVREGHLGTTAVSELEQLGSCRSHKADELDVTSHQCPSVIESLDVNKWPQS